MVAVNQKILFKILYLRARVFDPNLNYFIDFFFRKHCHLHNPASADYAVSLITLGTKVSKHINNINHYVAYPIVNKPFNPIGTFEYIKTDFPIKMVSSLKRTRYNDSDEDNLDSNADLHMSNRRRTRRIPSKSYAETDSEDQSEPDDLKSDSNLDSYNTRTFSETGLENNTYLVTLRIGTTAARSISEQSQNTGNDFTSHLEEKVEEENTTGNTHDSEKTHLTVVDDHHDKTQSVNDYSMPSNSEGSNHEIANHEHNEQPNSNEDDKNIGKCLFKFPLFGTFFLPREKNQKKKKKKKKNNFFCLFLTPCF